MAKPAPCPVPEGLDPLLPGHDFADSFSVAVQPGRFDAVSAAHKALDRGPAWVAALLGLRNLLVAPLGLRGTGEAGPEPRIGWFPVVSASPERVVLGFDDKHLDFRIVIDHEVAGVVRATTLVRRHNLGGKLYLATIMPFHKAIVPRMLAALNA